MQVEIYKKIVKKLKRSSLHIFKKWKNVGKNRGGKRRQGGLASSN